MTLTSRLGYWKFAPVVASLLLAVAPARAETASTDDTARFLAGMSVPETSPLAPLEKDGGWTRYKSSLDTTFDRVEKRQLSKIRAWSSANLTQRRSTLFYFFSGPDFLYANSFFPDASTYVLAGLEPVGALPDVTKISRGSVPGALQALQVSTRSLLGLSFFKTIDMKAELHSNPLNGTLPILYVFMARSGKVVKNAELVRLSETGDVQTGADAKGRTQGVRITFSAPGGPDQTLYYFSANLANDGFKKGGLGPFCEKLGVGDGLVKSASYLLQEGGFSQARNFLLQNTASIVQDDTGVPAASFDAKWTLKPYGRYTRPIGLFPNAFQPKMAELFKKSPGPLGFGIGYNYQPNASGLLLATKQETAQAQ